MISAGDKSMWNTKKYSAIAVLGAGLVVAAATPALSQCGFGGIGWGGGYGGYGGYGGGCGGYGLGGYGGCGGYGYGGGYGAGYGGYGGYGGCGGYGFAGYGGGCGGYGLAVVPVYGSGGYGGCGGYGGYGGIGYGGYGGWGGGYGFGGCHDRHDLHGHGSYDLAYMPRHYRSGYAYAAHTPRSHHAYHPVRHHLLASTKQMTRHG
jgi:hypothetical protein